MCETNNKNTAKSSARSVFSENLVNKQLAPEMRIAIEAANRVKLARNRLSCKEDTYVYKKVF